MNIAVIFAGGAGKRMNSKVKPKQFLELRGKPIIIHTLEHFENHNEIDCIIVVCIEGWIDYLTELLKKYNIKKVVRIVPGGETGQLSIKNGLEIAKEISKGEKSIVLIHDGVRPLINRELITNNIYTVEQFGSAITSAKVVETIMEVSNQGNIEYIPTRENSRYARAPQSFWLDEIYEAHKRALEDEITDFIDSCTMMQHYGHSLHLIDGPADNMKITTPEDFYIARAILDAKENEQIYGIGDEK